MDYSHIIPFSGNLTFQTLAVCGIKREAKYICIYRFLILYNKIKNNDQTYTLFPYKKL